MQVLNLLFAVMFSTMSLVVLVVLVLQSFHLDLKPSLAENVPTLLITAACFGAIGGLAIVASVARYRQWASRWLWQVGLFLVGAVLCLYLVALYSQP